MLGQWHNIGDYITFFSHMQSSLCYEFLMKLSKYLIVDFDNKISVYKDFYLKFEMCVNNKYLIARPICNPKMNRKVFQLCTYYAKYCLETIFSNKTFAMVVSVAATGSVFLKELVSDSLI